MRASVRRMGNSAGIILPKPVLAELGVKAGDDLSLTLEKGRVVLAPAKAHPRSGWAEASKVLAGSGLDALVWDALVWDALVWDALVWPEFAE